jgi:membrane protein YqaA with SNARE-associated domain
MTVYFSLFLTCFLSATILPFSSEVALLAMVQSKQNVFNLLLIATIGNTFGGLTNYFLGYLGNPVWLRKLGMDDTQIQMHNRRIQKYGCWLAFFSWVPIIGDPLMISLGFFRASWFPVIVLCLVGKFLRYFVLIFPFF